MNRILATAFLVAAVACAKRVEPTAAKMSPDAEAQKKTMQAMRAIATAWEAYATDHNSYVAAGYETLPVGVFHSDVNALLVPAYIKSLPEFDAWGNPYAFRIAMDEQNKRAIAYEIISFGKNGTRDPVVGDVFTDPNGDIIWSQGNFVTRPDGVE